MTDYFLLDPDYKDFDFPDRHKLKFRTVYGEQHKDIALTLAGTAFMGLLILFLFFKWLPEEWLYLRTSLHTTGVVTKTCSPLQQWYEYSFEAWNAKGDLNHYTGKIDQYKNDVCPKRGELISLEYLPDHPELSTRTTGDTLIFNNLCGISFLLIFAAVMIRYFIRDIRAFLRARPKYERLTKSSAIVSGTIFSIMDSTKTGVGRTRNHYVEVEYRFSVYERNFYGTQTKLRNDLSNKPLPPPGTPVRILYADENTYIML
jgi:hypothetical protein